MPNKDLFYTFTNVECGKVLMGNNHVCKEMGIRTVRLKIYDGIVQTLDEVRYLLNMKKNLISIGALDSGRYKIVLKARILKIISNALVVMREKKDGNLYFL